VAIELFKYVSWVLVDDDNQTTNKELNCMGKGGGKAVSTTAKAVKFRF